LSPLLALGVLAALGSSLLYCGGAALQALEARDCPSAYGLHTTLIRRLLTRPRWILGTACVLAGWGLQAVSLLLAPVTIVQPTLAVGLVALLFIGLRLLDERVGRQEILGVAAILVGVAGLALSAPDSSRQHASSAVLGIALLAFAVVALAPYAFRSHRYLGVLVIVSGGVAYAWTGFSTNFAGDALSSGRWLVFGLWMAATVGAALIGLLSEMTAFQHGPVTHVFPVMLVVQIVIAVALSPLLAGEGWGTTPFDGFALAASLAVVTVGAASLAGGRGVGAAMASSS
jgi:drug/metabolite transporter (DMT)-like permease